MFPTFFRHCNFWSADRGFYNTLPGEDDIEFTQFSREDMEETFPSHPTFEDRTLGEDSKFEWFLTHEFEISELDKDKDFSSVPEAAYKTKEDIEAFTQITKQLKKPYYIALGENDVHKASGIKKEDYMRYANYHNKYLKTDSPNYSVNLSNKITMLVLDGASPVVKNTHGYFSEKTLLWFDKQLKKNKNKKVVIIKK